MKILAVKLIDLYQVFLSLVLKNLLGTSRFCRHAPTCSDYTKTMILEKGVIKGSILGMLRILRCQPFMKASYG